MGKNDAPATGGKNDDGSGTVKDEIAWYEGVKKINDALDAKKGWEEQNKKS
jgi:hypothetical protein